MCEIELDRLFRNKPEESAEDERPPVSQEVAALSRPPLGAGAASRCGGPFGFRTGPPSPLLARPPLAARDLFSDFPPAGLVRDGRGSGQGAPSACRPATFSSWLPPFARKILVDSRFVRPVYAASEKASGRGGLGGGP